MRAKGGRAGLRSCVGKYQPFSGTRQALVTRKPGVCLGPQSLEAIKSARLYQVLMWSSELHLPPVHRIYIALQLVVFDQPLSCFPSQLRAWRPAVRE